MFYHKQECLFGVYLVFNCAKTPKIQHKIIKTKMSKTRIISALFKHY